MSAPDASPQERSRFERFWRWLTWGDDRDVAAHGKELVAEWEAIEPERDALERRLDQLRNDLAGATTSDRLAELERRSGEIGEESVAFVAKRAKISDALQQSTAQLRAINAKRQRHVTHAAQIGFLIQLITGVILLIATSYSAKTAAKIHVEYYSAVAAIAPVLLVAGFVELAVIKPPGSGWVILTFAVPLVTAMSVSLAALATHKSTPDELVLTIWGLIAAMVALISYVLQHAAIHERSLAPG